jgi:hypothetical protein
MQVKLAKGHYKCSYDDLNQSQRKIDLPFSTKLQKFASVIGSFIQPINIY